MSATVPVSSQVKNQLSPSKSTWRLLLIGRAAIAPLRVLVDSTVKSMSFIFSASSERLFSAMQKLLIRVFRPNRPRGQRFKPGPLARRHRALYVRGEGQGAAR